MTYPTTCPICGTSLIAGKIPKGSRHLYGNARFYTRAEAQLQGEVVVAWRCPDCRHTFPRREVLPAHISEQ